VHNLDKVILCVCVCVCVFAYSIQVDAPPSPLHVGSTVFSMQSSVLGRPPKALLDVCDVINVEAVDPAVSVKVKRAPKASAWPVAGNGCCCFICLIVCFNFIHQAHWCRV
jgi:hypothetical protein